MSQGTAGKQVRVVRSLATGTGPQILVIPLSFPPHTQGADTHLQWEALRSGSYSPSYEAGISPGPDDAPPAPFQAGNPQRRAGGWD